MYPFTYKMELAGGPVQHVICVMNSGRWGGQVGIFEKALGLETENTAAEPGYVSCLGGNVCSPRQ